MKDTIILLWAKLSDYNIGDELSPYITEKLSEKKVCRYDNDEHIKTDEDVYAVIGSIIYYIALDPKHNIKVWGCGAHSHHNPGRNKLDYIAVRGPRTQQILEKKWGKLDLVLGDPGLIMPLLYSPDTVDKTIDVGIIPHIYDYNKEYMKGMVHPWLNNFGIEKDEDSGLTVKVLDVRTNKVEDFIDSLVSCKYILSASLHGLILAEAYKIDYKFVRFSSSTRQQKIFKYDDFYSYLGIKTPVPVMIEPDSTLTEIFHDGGCRVPESHNLEKLIKACPFLSENVKFNTYST